MSPSTGSKKTSQTPSIITTPLVAVSAIFPLLSAVSIYFRLLAKRYVRQPFYAEDGWIIASWILSLPLSVLIWVFSIKSGVDYYKVDSVQGTHDSIEVIFLNGCLLQSSLAAVKISVLLFYKRIFSPSRVFRLCTWIAVGVVTVWGLVFTFLVITHVDPISESWHGGRIRYNMTAMGLAQAGSSIVLDVAVLCFPVPIISRLHMSAKRKLMVMFMFWLGALCCVAAITRMILLNQSLRTLVESQTNIYLQSRQFIFMIIEPNCSIIAACFPCYGPLIEGIHSRTPKPTPRTHLLFFKARNPTSLHKGLWGGEHPHSTLSGGSSGELDSQAELNIRNGWPGESR